MKLNWFYNHLHFVVIWAVLYKKIIQNDPSASLLDNYTHFAS